MKENGQTLASTPAVLQVAAGEDRFGEPRGLGRSNIAFKVAAQDSSAMFILEITTHSKGGPERHLHREQEEWFYVVEGGFILEAGEKRTTLNVGDSLLVPRGVPHAWASLSAAVGRLLIVFTPAGPMEAFFRKVAPSDSVPGPTPELWRTYGMEWIGPPLSVA